MPNHVAVGLVLTASLLFGSAFAARWQQDRIMISFWVDPIVPPEEFDARYAEIAGANFTVVLGGFGALNLSMIELQLAVSEKYGLKVIADTGGIPPSQLPSSSPALWGYRLFDEPSAQLFGQLRNTTDLIRKYIPGALSYINLLPNYGNGAWGTPTYEQYVSEFVQTCDPDVLSVDNYPLMQPGQDSRDGYCANLATLRQYALQSNVPFWNFFNSMPFDTHIDPTEANLRWQVFTSLAYGAKGVMYFCYWTPVGASFMNGGGIITPQGSPTNYVKGRHYYQAQRINSVVLSFSPTLMASTTTGVYRVAPTDNPVTALSGCVISNLTAGGDYLVGQFQHQDGRIVVMLNNYDMYDTQWPTVTFNVADISQVQEISPINGSESPVVDESPLIPGLQLSLDAAQSRLFIVNK